MIGGTGGRISLFTTSMPTIGAGSLRPRENMNERSFGEAKFLGPATDFYKTFALDCAAQQVCLLYGYTHNQQWVQYEHVVHDSNFIQLTEWGKQEE